MAIFSFAFFIKISKIIDLKALRISDFF